MTASLIVAIVFRIIFYVIELGMVLFFITWIVGHVKKSESYLFNSTDDLKYIVVLPKGSISNH